LASIKIERLSQEFEYRVVDDLYEALGCGDIPIGRIVNFLTVDETETDELEVFRQLSTEVSEVDTDSVTVLGLKGLLTTMGRCCNPAPGDEIVGYITRGRGATIHRKDCPNIMSVRDRERLARVSWGEPKSRYPIPVVIKAYDRDGLMRDVSTLIDEEGVNMTKVTVDVNKKNLAVFELILEVRDLAHLSKVLDRLENLDNVLEARRTRPG